MAMTESQRNYIKDNRDKINEYQREYRAKNNEKMKEFYTSDYHKHRDARVKYRQDRHKNSPWYTMATMSKGRAKKQDLPYDIDAAYLESIWPTGNKCPVFGCDFTISKKGESRDSSPSLDRIVPELGYVKGNVIIVSLKANRMKNNGTIEDLRKVLDYYSNINA